MSADDATVGRTPIESEFLRPEDSAIAEPGKPRVWTAFVALIAALFAIILCQIAMSAVMALWLVSQGTPAMQIGPALLEIIPTPWGFMLFGLGSQVAMGGTALLAARLSPVPLAERLGLGRSGLSPLGFVTVAFGSWVPLALSLALVFSLPENIPTDPSVATMYGKMTWASAIPFLLFISLAPGFCEEILFRGYVQRQFLARWSPWIAILVTSVLFALFHIMPHGIAVAFPLGVWLGWLAWKTGSVWPGVVCHAFVNGSWNVYQIGVHLGVLSEDPPLSALVAVGLIAVAAFIGSLCLVDKWAEPSADEVV